MARYTGPIVDVDLHHQPGSEAELVERMPKRWREYAAGGGRFGPHGRMLYGPIMAHGAKLADSWAEDGSAPASSYEFTREQLFDKHNFYRILLNAIPPEGLNPYAAPVYARALNDWSIDCWLGVDDERLYSVVHLPGGDPDDAAKEIRRVGGHPRISGVLFSGPKYSRPIGERMFDPIYKAAAELNLPFEMHPGISAYESQAGGIANSSIVTVPTFLSQLAMHQVTSLIVNGTFEKFPTLTFLIKEHGVLWVQHLMWKLDGMYKHLKAESVWVKKWPSEYIREHVRIGSHPLEQGFAGNGKDVNEVLLATDGMEDMLCFATDYPHINTDDPAYVARRLPQSWLRKVMYENACKHYHWELPPPDFGQSTKKPDLVGAGA